MPSSPPRSLTENRGEAAMGEADAGEATASGGVASNGAPAGKGAHSLSEEGRQREERAGLQERLSAYRRERREERPERRPEVAVPSFFTLLNLFCGFLALTQVFEGQFVWACWLIVLAGFFDMLDGLMARLADAQSPFGVELDSLSDVVSFGVAPAFLVWTYGLNEMGPLGLIVAALPALCGAVRLARYNVGFDGEKSDTYRGLPVPAQAVTLVALILSLEGMAGFGPAEEGILSILIPVVFVLAGLMVSSVRFGAFPKPTPAYARAHPYTASAFVACVLLLPFLQELALLIFLVGYIATGIAQSTYRLVEAIRNVPLEPEERSAPTGE